MTSFVNHHAQNDGTYAVHHISLLMLDLNIQCEPAHVRAQSTNEIVGTNLEFQDWSWESQPDSACDYSAIIQALQRGGEPFPEYRGAHLPDKSTQVAESATDLYFLGCDYGIAVANAAC